MNTILYKMNHKKITATITLPGMLMEELVQYAKKKKISRDEVIEIATKKLLEKEIKNDLRRTFTLAANDKELPEMTEWGLKDYVEQLKKLDNKL
ncbi:MAG: hypothetical protein ABI863_21255 [Ginsengibacter sp.]